MLCYVFSLFEVSTGHEYGDSASVTNFPRGSTSCSLSPPASTVFSLSFGSPKMLTLWVSGSSSSSESLWLSHHAPNHVRDSCLMFTGGPRRAPYPFVKLEGFQFSCCVFGISSSVIPRILLRSYSLTDVMARTTLPCLIDTGIIFMRVYVHVLYLCSGCASITFSSFSCAKSQNADCFFCFVTPCWV